MGTLQVKAQETMSLEGKWSVKLDSLDVGINQKGFNQQFEAVIQLPGTLDDAEIGKPTNLTADSLYKEVLIKLSRKHSYIGPAWYSREIEIPESWKDKAIRLALERVIWNTRVWVDGKEVGSGESLSVPQRFDLSSSLRSGKHLIAIRIDNRKQHDISYSNMGHAYTDGTQIIWNGVIGKLQLNAKELQNIERIQTYPNVREKSVQVKVFLRNGGKKATKGTLQVRVYDKDQRLVSSKNSTVSLSPGETNSVLDLNLGSEAKLWDEFHPELYTIKAELVASKSKDAATTTFGLRDIASKENILNNGTPVFLRGTLECNIFPLTGYPPMNKQGWLKVFQSAREYGLNHLRFHSWCPPKAAFAVANSLGFFLQIELPLWSLTVGKDGNTNRFLEDEAVRISQEYGNHPSFCLWSLGNELEGDFSWMHSLIEKLKALDNRHLYTTTTFSFQKGHGDWPENGDQFFISQKTKNGWVRGQGIFNSYEPKFPTDYSTSIQGMAVP